MFKDTEIYFDEDYFIGNDSESTNVELTELGKPIIGCRRMNRED